MRVEGLRTIHEVRFTTIDERRRGEARYCVFGSFGLSPPKIARPFRGQVGPQDAPGDEGRIRAFRIGADRIGRIVKRQPGALAGLARRLEHHGADLEQARLQALEPLVVARLVGAALLLLGSQGGDHRVLDLDHRPAVVGQVGEEGADADALLGLLVPEHGFERGVRMRAAGIGIVGAQDADVAIGDHRHHRVVALQRPALAAAEQFRRILPFAVGFATLTVGPALAFAEDVGGKLGPGLDRVVESDADFDSLGLGGDDRLRRAPRAQARPEAASPAILVMPQRSTVYSAASLECPRRTLSLRTSSSAASAITVPGGKIASAPALVSAS